VVNADSALSRWVGNEYLRLRGLPETHAVWLPGVPSMGPIDIAAFRERVWQPIRAHLREHRLEEEIDVIAYSADFPYAVGFDADLKSRRLPKSNFRGTVGSLTGLTFFARRVAIGDLGYLGPNRYFRANLAPAPVAGRESTAAEQKRLDEAEQALKKREYPQAIEAYRALLADYPWMARAWHDLAGALAAVGQTDEALATLGTAVDYGWAHALTTRNDALFKAVRGQPAFERELQRMRAAAGPFQAAHGFRSAYVWSTVASIHDLDASRSLDRYYLAVMLAYTGARGNSVPEVMRYLRAAAASDGARPDGTVYLMENQNIRSEARERYFHATARALRERGRRVEVLARGEAGQDGVLPKGKDDVVGVVIGADSFSWARSGSRLLAGALAESLTSYGGDFDRPKQTKLSELLRHGAAGSSGAVAEPYAIQAKFPVAYLHVHYADGASLAEAFYQSVETPYQLLVVGDPLARPFAYPSQVSLASPDPRAVWAGEVSIAPAVAAPPGRPAREVELWVDGQWVATARPGQPNRWDTRTVEDGYHDLRLVAVEDRAIETRSALEVTITVANAGRSVTLEAPPAVPFGEMLVLSGSAAGAERVEVFHGVRSLGAPAVTDGRWRLELASAPLGPGPVRLFARARFPDGVRARSAPATVLVSDPPLAGPVEPPPEGAVGLTAHARFADGSVREARLEPGRAGLGGLLKGPVRAEEVRIEGHFAVGAAGLYQLGLRARGQAEVVVDGATLLATDLSAERAEALIALGLEAGWHRLQVTVRQPEGARPRLVLSGQEAAVVLSE
jgi:tetratricopeptide (TPR) repeat protein